ncbi:hypothetical protein PR048_015192 [Dryococelus australis]|uniref:PDZ domain-containing protein n=1 Tax=Dryococelus australis TaxID=614101 RepID=A0ABQ9HGA3_9NEOP|nr:hypothetical protein PR048_015192 [Dryococelus australis]
MLHFSSPFIHKEEIHKEEVQKEESVPEVSGLEESRTDRSAEVVCVASAKEEDSDSERDHVGGVEQTQERLGYEPSIDSEATVSDSAAASSSGQGEDSEASPGVDAMTVTRTDKQQPSSVLLAKHWGPERTVEILREPNCSLGISIVGGKVSDELTTVAHFHHKQIQHYFYAYIFSL